MKTNDFIKAIQLLRPCRDGIELARQFKTIRSWWNSKQVPDNNRLWLWLLIAASDTDDTFINEIVEYLVSINRCPVIWKGQYCSCVRNDPKTLLMDFKELRNSRYMSGNLRGLLIHYEGSPKFRDVFRCPTMAELKQVVTWLS